MSYFTSTAKRSRTHSLHGMGCGCGMNGLGDMIALPATLATPGEMVAAIDLINRSVTSLNADVQANAQRLHATQDGIRFFSQWQIFKAEWITFFTDHNRGTSFATRIGPLEYGSGQLAAQIRDKATAYNAMEQRYRNLGLEPTITAAVPLEERLSNLGTGAFITAGLGIAAVVAVGYLLSNYAKIKMMSRLAFNGRRSRRRKRSR